MASGAPGPVIEDHNGAVLDATAGSLDGTHIVVTAGDGDLLRVWGLADSTLLTRIPMTGCYGVNYAEGVLLAATHLGVCSIDLGARG